MRFIAKQALILPAIIGVLATAGVGAAALDTPATVQTGEAPGGPAGGPGGPTGGPGAGPMRGHMMQGRFMPGRHIEGRIAFLRAELKITPAQSAQFDKVAAVMRDNAKETAQLFEQARAARGAGTTPDAVTRMNQRVKFAEARVSGMKKFVEAFTPLYQSLSDEQKKSADELLSHMRG
jgi:protein CpxP